MTKAHLRGGLRGPDPEIPGLKPWNPKVRILTKCISPHPEIKKKIFNHEIPSLKPPDPDVPNKSCLPLTSTILSFWPNHYINLYAPFMGIMFSSLFVRSFVRASFPLQVKVFVEVVFDEVEVQPTRNLVNMFPMIWSFLF